MLFVVANIHLAHKRIQVCKSYTFFALSNQIRPFKESPYFLKQIKKKKTY